MNRLIAVHAPAQVIGDVIVISVELWTHGVFVHRANIESEETDRLVAGYHAALSAGEFPQQPGAGLGQDLELSDDAGTRYRARSGQAGGTGTEWRALWEFVLRVPEHSSRLTIATGGGTMELEL